MDALKEPEISCTFVGWTYRLGEGKVYAVNKFLFSNKYKGLSFVLPDTSHMHCIHKEDIVLRRHYRWVIYAQCDIPGVEEDELTLP